MISELNKRKWHDTAPRNHMFCCIDKDGIHRYLRSPHWCSRRIRYTQWNMKSSNKKLACCRETCHSASCHSVQGWNMYAKMCSPHRNAGDQKTFQKIKPAMPIQSTISAKVLCLSPRAVGEQGLAIPQLQIVCAPCYFRKISSTLWT